MTTRSNLITLSNSFHKTECNVERETYEAVSQRVDENKTDSNDRKYIHRIWKKLCGTNGCHCGNTFGERA